MSEGFDITTHELVPEHKKLSEENKNKLLEKMNLSLRQLPQILQVDPAIQHLEAEPGDVIQIIRKSETVGESVYYRVVVHG